jgi:hypothetical protein
LKQNILFLTLSGRNWGHPLKVPCKEKKLLLYQKIIVFCFHGVPSATVGLPFLLPAAIEKGNIKIALDVLVAGGGNAADGLMGMLIKLLPGVDISTFLKKPVISASETS